MDGFDPAVQTDGEELLLCKAIYPVTDKAVVTGALERCVEFVEDESRDPKQKCFAWLNDKKTLLGRIAVGSRELVMECNSRERAERGKLLLAGLAGESLSHWRDEFTTQKNIREKAKRADRWSSMNEWTDSLRAL